MIQFSRASCVASTIPPILGETAYLVAICAPWQPKPLSKLNVVPVLRCSSRVVLCCQVDVNVCRSPPTAPFSPSLWTQNCYTQEALTQLGKAWTKDRLGSAAGADEMARAASLGSEVRSVLFVLLPTCMRVAAARHGCRHILFFQDYDCFFQECDCYPREGCVRGSCGASTFRPGR